VSDEINSAVDRETDASYLSFKPGERLKKARELRGLTVPQVARELHLSERFVVAMEADDYSVLPEPAFVRGYMRRYAQLVKLSADDIVARFDESYASLRSTPEAAGQARNPIQLLGELSHKNVGWGQLAKWAMALVLLLLVTVGTVLWRKGTAKPQPLLTVDSAPPAVSAPLTQIPSPVVLPPGSLPAMAAGSELPAAPSSLPSLPANAGTDSTAPASAPAGTGH